MLVGSRKITIIIPTACTTGRAKRLHRAIASIQVAGPGLATTIVAANGPNISPDLLQELTGRRDIEVVKFEEGSAPLALARALPFVTTEYFGFLDDDDELLPNSLQRRLTKIQNEPNADVLLSNGFLRRANADQNYLNYLKDVPSDPLGTFFVENWLPSCGALFRKATVDMTYFENYHPYAEWSWLAFRLALDKKRFAILDEPTFRVYADTPFSLSKSDEYRQSYISLYKRMLTATVPSKVRRVIQKRLSQAHHDVSSYALADGKLRQSIRHHIESLRYPSGWIFFTYTRHIIAAAMKQ